MLFRQHLAPVCALAHLGFNVVGYHVACCEFPAAAERAVDRINPRATLPCELTNESSALNCACSLLRTVV
jgi:hypothetical protein